MGELLSPSLLPPPLKPSTGLGGDETTVRRRSIPSLFDFNGASGIKSNRPDMVITHRFQSKTRKSKTHRQMVIVLVIGRIVCIYFSVTRNLLCDGIREPWNIRRYF